METMKEALTKEGSSDQVSNLTSNAQKMTEAEMKAFVEKAIAPSGFKKEDMDSVANLAMKRLNKGQAACPWDICKSISLESMKDNVHGGSW